MGITDQLPGKTTNVRARDLWYSYPRHTVLRGINLELTPGTVTALHGPNGSGKSTLLDLLSGLKKPHSGHLIVPTKRPAYVPQRTNINPQLPLTVRQIVAMGTWTHRRLLKPLRRGDHQDIHRAMRQLHIEQLARRRLDEISGGQLQRALLARALTTDSTVLLLDEPTTGLDSESRDIITATLANCAAQGTIVFHATHNPEAINASDRTLHLDDGTIHSRETANTTR